MTHAVVFAPEAQEELVAIYRYIAATASPTIAAAYTDAIVTRCEGLGLFPHIGTQRDDIRPGLRIIGFKRRVAITFTVGDDRVTIVGVFYGGQDYELVLQEDMDIAEWRAG